MFHAETKSYLVSSLRNDPGKKGSDFFCYGAIRCPHIAKSSFLHREYVNLQKAVYEIKCRNYIFNRCFFVVKDFNQYNSQEKFTILHVPHKGFLCY